MSRPQRITHETLKLVVISPGDVAEERSRVIRVTDEINNGIGEALGVRIEPRLWETDTYPAVHKEGGQGHIDDLLRIEDANVVVAIFWKRFGTPVAGAGSGTEHEWRNASQSWKARGRPQMMAYFNTLEYYLDSAEDHRQADAVTTFRDSLSGSALWWKYHGVDEFEQLLRKHLTAWLRETHGEITGKQSAILAGVLEPPVFHDQILRTDLLARLAAITRTQPIVAVEGLSGSGKTYLAAALAAKCVSEKRYNFVWWHQPELHETIDTLLARSEHSPASLQQSIGAQTRALVRQLGDRGGLLVIDDFHLVNATSYVVLLEAARGISPPARILLLSQTYTDSDPKGETAHLEVEGFDRKELQTFLNYRGTDLLPPTLESLAVNTGGLPIAASFFATLVTRFGHDPDELLHGSVSWQQRLHGWFGRICALLDRESLALLRNLSVSDTPFNRGGIREVALSLRLPSPDLSFDTLQRAYLVQRYGGSRWRIHPLVASFALEAMKQRDVVAANLAFARYYAGGFPHRVTGLLPDQEFTHRVLACRHYQRAGSLHKAEKVIARIVKTAKARGLYELLLQLLEKQLTVPDRDLWMDYHYAHCRLITGNVADAAAVLERTRERAAAVDELAISLTRLHAEVLRSSGERDKALEILQGKLAEVVAVQLRGPVLAQARSLSALLFLETGQPDEAEKICSATAVRGQCEAGQARLRSRVYDPRPDRRRQTGPGHRLAPIAGRRYIFQRMRRQPRVILG